MDSGVFNETQLAFAKLINRVYVVLATLERAGRMASWPLAAIADLLSNPQSVQGIVLRLSPALQVI